MNSTSTKNDRTILVLSIIVIILALIASCAGIFSTGGNGQYTYRSIRGQDILIYGIGIYKDMSAGVAIQGIAQDYVTLFIAIPLLALILLANRKGGLRLRFIQAGVLNYFFVTYLFYMQMAMYNPLFIMYIMLTGCSFFALALSLIQIGVKELPSRFGAKSPNRMTGIFLICMSSAIALLWLQIIMFPLVQGQITPTQVEHYTTLTVQGFDLSLLLPIAFVSGILVLRRNPWGYLIATVTLVFLDLLMSALLAKIIFMAMTGANVVPAVFIIPVILIGSLWISWRMIRSIQHPINPTA